MDIRLKKKELRKKMLALRDNLTQDEIEEKSRKIQSSFLSLPELINAKNIFIFVNFRSEVKTTSIIEELLKSGKKVITPFTDIPNKKLDLYFINSLSDLKEGSYNILEPNPDICSKAVVNDIDLAVIPGSAFDLKGGRMGYGGGFYDRIIPSLRKDVPKLAVCFDFQILDKVPMGYYDCRVDIIVTEKRVINLKK